MIKPEQLAMTPGDIRTHYRSTKGTPREKVNRLAELNAIDSYPTNTIKARVIDILGDLIPPELHNSLYGKSRYSDELFRYLYKQGLCDGEITRQTGATYDTVWRWRKRNNLELNNPRYKVLTPEILAKWRELYDQGCNDRQIAQAQGVSADTVGKWRRGLGLGCNRRKQKNAKVLKDATESLETKHKAARSGGTV